MNTFDDPLGYIKLSEELSKWTSDSELKFSKERTIISRLYYGVFYFIKCKLGKESNKINHKRIREEIQKYAEKKGIDFNFKDSLAQLYRLRENADYYEKPKIDEKSVREAWDLYDVLKDKLLEVWDE
jgi:uncharacterized protein (UPF0332 family)